MNTFTVSTDVGDVVVTTQHGLAGQVVYTTTWPDGSLATFVGSVFGSPGPITLLMQQWVDQFHITKPERFGSTFDREWMERYITGREVTHECVPSTVTTSTHYLPNDDLPTGHRRAADDEDLRIIRKYNDDHEDDE